MFTDKAKEWIQKEIKLDDINNRIKYLEMALQVSENISVVDNLKSSIADQINAFSVSSDNIIIDAFSKVTQFLEIFICLKDVNEAKKLEKGNSDNIPRYLADLGIITINQREEIFAHFNSSNYFSPNDMMYHYAKCYKLRNKKAHTDEHFTLKELWDYVDSILMVYLTVATKFSKELQTEVNFIELKNLTKADVYVKNMIQQYEQKLKNKFTYIPLEAINEKTGNEKNRKLQDIILSAPNKKLKIIGTAGVGKSTTLEYLAYKDAKSFHGVVPVLINLKNISDINKGVLKQLQICLQCSEDIVIKLLESGSIHLYLDGVNEILLSTKDKKIIINEIDSMIGRYDAAKIIVTDRENSDLSISDNIPTYIVQKLTDEKIKEFIKGNSYNEDIYKKVFNILFEQEDKYSYLLEMVRVPFYLQNLIEIVSINGEIPSNEIEFSKNFLEAILRREAVEKETIGAYNLETYLIEIALLDKDIYSRSTLISIISKTIEKYHLSDEHSDKILELLLQLHILEECSFLEYRFTNEHYKTCFIFKGME